jgi:hypothetical protein
MKKVLAANRQKIDVSTDKNKVLNVLKRIFKTYQYICYVAVTVFVMLVFILLLMNVGMRPISPNTPNEATAANNVSNSEETYNNNLLAVNPGKTLDEILEIEKQVGQAAAGINVFQDTWTPYHSKYANLSENGYREIPDQQPFALGENVKNVFFFGGSTTYGYNVSDGETIAAHFSQLINATGSGTKYNIYNFGKPSCYSVYEKKEFEELLMKGIIPDYVFFIDGLNDFCRIAIDLKSYAPSPSSEPTIYTRLNNFIESKIVQPYVYWRGRIFHVVPKAQDWHIDYNVEAVQEAANEMLANWKLIRGICQGYGIKCYFILQPIPVYEYPMGKNLFLSESDLAKGEHFFHYAAARDGYTLLFDKKLLSSVTFTDLHKLSVEGYEYVDSCHYTNAFSERIARSLVALVIQDR